MIHQIVVTWPTF